MRIIPIKLWSIILLICTFSSMSVYADENIAISPVSKPDTRPTGGVYLEATGFAADESEEEDDSLSLASEPDWKGFYEALLAGTAVHQTEIDVSACNFRYPQDTEMLQDKYDKFVMIHPEMLVWTKFNYTYTNNKISKIYPGYLFANKAEDDEARAIMKIEMDKYVQLASKVDEPLEKLLLVHDEIIKNCIYNDAAIVEGANIEDFKESYHAYGLFANKTAVCQGYSQAIYIICEKLGIEEKFCLSDEITHMWNYVKLDDKWYHMDVTWDDLDDYPIEGNSMAIHNYFLLSDETMMVDGKHGAKNTWKTFDHEQPDCDSKKFEKGYLFNYASGLYNPFSVEVVGDYIGYRLNLDDMSLFFGAESLRVGDVITTQPLLDQSGKMYYMYLQIPDEDIDIYANVLGRLDIIELESQSMFYYYEVDVSTDIPYQKGDAIYFWDSKTLKPHGTKVLLAK